MPITHHRKITILLAGMVVGPGGVILAFAGLVKQKRDGAAVASDTVLTLAIVAVAIRLIYVIGSYRRGLNVTSLEQLDGTHTTSIVQANTSLTPTLATAAVLAVLLLRALTSGRDTAPH